MKFYTKIGNRPINKRLNFGGNRPTSVAMATKMCVEHAGETRRHAVLSVTAVLRRVIYDDSSDGATRRGQCQFLGGGLRSPTAF